MTMMARPTSMIACTCRLLTVVFVLVGLSCAHTSSQSAERAEPFAAAAPHQSTPPIWPAVVDGQRVKRTFRFRPAWVEYRPMETRRPSINVVFKIEDPEIPADYFMVRCWDTELEAFKQDVAADDGYITVEAEWVNAPVPRIEFRGAPALWVDGRILLGRLQTKRHNGE